MQNLINRIGAKYGWQKRWSDAQSEPWHFKYRAGIWSGPDPGPTGAPAPQPQPKPEEDMAKILVLYNADGRVEVHSIATGNPFHNWMQKDGKWSGWRAFKGGPLDEIEGARHPDGHLEVFGRRGGKTLHAWQRGPNGTWTDTFVPL